MHSNRETTQLTSQQTNNADRDHRNCLQKESCSYQPWTKARGECFIKPGCQAFPLATPLTLLSGVRSTRTNVLVSPCCSDVSLFLDTCLHFLVFTSLWLLMTWLLENETMHFNDAALYLRKRDSCKWTWTDTNMCRVAQVEIFDILEENFAFPRHYNCNS